MQVNTITMDSVISRSKNQVSTEIDGDIVLLSIDQGKYYSMNKMLSTIWGWLEQPMKVSDICSKMTETYEVNDDVCENDVMQVLGDLQREELIDLR